MRSITKYDAGVELRHLRSFEAVVRCGGFTRAAQDLLVAQPAISAHIKRLEQELGVQLLHRSRTVQLSAAGERLLPHVRAALAELDEGRRQVQDLRTVQSGRVRVGVTPLTGGLDLVAVLSRFRVRYPGVTVTLRTGLVADLVQDLRAGQVDVVVGPSRLAPQGLHRIELVPERLVLITPPGDRRTVRSLRDVAADTFVCLAAESGLRRMLDQAFADVEADPKVDLETHSPAGIRELVSAGLGSALIAASAAGGPGTAVRVHTLPGLPEHSPICALAPARTDPPVTRFIQELRRPTPEA